jgi:UDP-4-amino-4,6-dideoxy-N-acetyl-beta-L-altrosamine transaminase
LDHSGPTQIDDWNHVKTIPYGRQDITQADIDHVVEVLKSDWLTQGPAIDKFETAMANYCGVKYAVVVNSATSALHIAVKALDVGKGDTLWTSPITFVASSNAALYCGASADFVDIDPETYNMSIDSLEKKLKAGKKPKVVIPVHFGGQSCDMKRVKALANEYGFKIVEDASHAVGSTYNRKKVGSCEFSDMAIFSFHPVKIMTTAEGGMVLTNNTELYEKLKILRTHGITRDPKRLKKSDGPWYYEQQELGFNYRLPDVLAALGFSQMKRIDEYVNRRNELVQRYQEKLKGLPLTWQKVHDDRLSAYHLFVIRLKLESIKKSRLDVYLALQERNVGVNLHYIPVYRQPYYQQFGYQLTDFPEAEKYYASAITIPLFPTMTEAQQDHVVESLKAVLGGE